MSAEFMTNNAPDSFYRPVYSVFFAIQNALLLLLYFRHVAFSRFAGTAKLLTGREQSTDPWRTLSSLAQDWRQTFDAASNLIEERVRDLC